VGGNCLYLNKHCISNASCLIKNYAFQNPIKIIFNNDDYTTNVFDILNSYKPPKKGFSTSPAKFDVTINNKIRTIHFPNFITYFYICNEIWKDSSFLNCSNNLMKIDCGNRKFKPNNYTEQSKKHKRKLQFEYESLTIYDIQNFYPSIYTHVFEKISNLEKDKGKKIDRLIRAMNNSKTKGILLGNLLSIKVADLIMQDITERIIKALDDCKIRHEIEFFSDQFYILHDDKNLVEINNILKGCLSEDYFQFEISEAKTKTLKYKDLSLGDNFGDYMKQLENILIKAIGTENSEEPPNKNKSYVQVEHFFKLLTSQLCTDNLESSVKFTYLRVVLRRFFNSHYYLQVLYLAAEIKPDVIITHVLFLISQYPVIIFDLFQLSILESINFKNMLDEKIWEILNIKLIINHYTMENEFIYWFLKIVVCDIHNIYDFELMPRKENKLLLAFLINKSNIWRKSQGNCISNNKMSELNDYFNDIVANLDNAKNENWLIYYEYGLYLKLNNKTLPNKPNYTISTN